MPTAAKPPAVELVKSVGDEMINEAVQLNEQISGPAYERPASQSGKCR